MDKTFDAAEAEPRIYARWERDGCFAAGANARPGAETFCIVIPPPNVTGSLHMGHALNNTLQDILVRWHRMQGRDVLWQPGTDHAGIATQMVVERRLAAEQQPGRREMGRAAFVEKVWEQKRESEGVILGQLKRLGASCDWSRTRFTMDDGLSDAVLKVFVDLYREGLIYRGKRLVNWDPHFETAISDLEVENVEVDGHMWHFKYPLAGGETYEYVERDEDGAVTLRETRDYISIATTRPETMLGDGAVAVHPDDERYAPIVGKLCEIPVGPKAHRRLIPIITDEYPDPAFGSGAVKITGAHDFNDYGVAKRNAIPCYRLMDTRAQMRADGAPYEEEAAKAQAIVEGAERTEEEIDAINLVPEAYRGLDRYEARKRVVADIVAEGLAVMVPETDPRLGGKRPVAPEEGGEERPLVPLVEAKKIMAPYGDRSKVVIEPMLTDQWFVDAATLAGPALEAVRAGETRFAPQAWEKTYFQWLENIEPWCISRQLWWGHQIPVWYGPDGAPFCAGSEAEALEQAAAHYGCPAEPTPQAELAEEERAAGLIHPREQQRLDLAAGRTPERVWLTRDEDVLDTWFSSALWPFSTLGWPADTEELARYYKTDVLVTGFDIIFFWVARMMMMGLHFMKDGEGRPEVPFHTVYVHALVRDAQGKKMSKSLGNVIDPLELIEEYGADAVRFTLTSMAAMGRDIKLAVSRVAGYRNFATKLWNAARFAEMNACDPVADFDPASCRETVNRWIVGETARVAAATDEALASFRFNDAANGLYAHVWGIFCDWYVELSKPLLTGEDEAARAETRATTAWALDQSLRLLHPIMPFVTEALWEQIGERVGGRDGPLVHADWPRLSPDLADPEADAEMGWVVRAIEEIRSVRAEMNVPAAARIPLVVTGHDAAVGARLARNGTLIERLARLSGIETADAPPEGAVTVALDDCVLTLPIADVIDVAAERARLDKTLSKLAKEIGQIEGKLGNERFLEKAPEEEVEKQRERLAAAAAERARLDGARARLAEIG